MGLLTEGSPLSWEETKQLSKHVQQHGIEQFIHLYERLRDRQGDILKWGDEVSCYCHWFFVYMTGWSINKLISGVNGFAFNR